MTALLPWEEGEKTAKERRKEEWHKQIYIADSVSDKKWESIVRRQGKLNKKESKLYSADFKVYLKDRREAVIDHVDRSVELFFLTAICCYETDFHYEWIAANDQYGKGRRAKAEKFDGEGLEHNTQGAHSSVLPCLMAYPREEWKDYKRNRGDLPEGFVYLKHSHFYTKNNGTMELERTINKADSRRDGTHIDRMLRERAIKIVNAVATGKYGPRKATKRFKKVYLQSLNEAHGKLKGGDGRKAVLKLYQERLEEIDLEDDQTFDEMLGVQVKHKDEGLLRKIVYQSRFTLIRESQEIESQIALMILKAQNKMCNRNTKSLSKVDDCLRYVLLKNMDGVMKKRMEKLFCTSLEQLQTGFDINKQRLRKFEKTNRIKTFRKNHKKEVKNLAGKIQKKFLLIQKKEFVYRAYLFKGLRQKFFKTQTAFSRKFNEMHSKKTDLRMSQPKVSCFEQVTRDSSGKTYSTPIKKRRTWIKIKDARLMAEVLGVQPAHFLPGTVASIY